MAVTASMVGNWATTWPQAISRKLAGSMPERRLVSPKGPRR